MMPCYDPPDYERIAREEAEKRKPAAVLCGLLRAHGPTILDAVNWQEVGLPRSWADQWWRQHRAEDERRLKRERDKAALRSEYGPPTGDTK